MFTQAEFKDTGREALLLLKSDCSDGSTSLPFPSNGPQGAWEQPYWYSASWLWLLAASIWLINSPSDGPVLCLLVTFSSMQLMWYSKCCHFFYALVYFCFLFNIVTLLRHILWQSVPNMISVDESWLYWAKLSTAITYAQEAARQGQARPMGKESTGKLGIVHVGEETPTSREAALYVTKDLPAPCKAERTLWKLY